MIEPRRTKFWETGVYQVEFDVNCDDRGYPTLTVTNIVDYMVRENIPMTAIIGSQEDETIIYLTWPI